MEDQMEVQIRRAEREDADRIADVLLQSFEEFRPQYTEAAFVATTPKVELISERMDEGPIWVAERDGNIVATVGATRQGAGLHVRSMAALSATRGLGVGKMLLDEVENYATDNSFPYMILCTTPFLFAAIRLYEGFGFQRRDEGPSDLYGTALFAMVKELGL